MRLALAVVTALLLATPLVHAQSAPSVSSAPAVPIAPMLSPSRSTASPQPRLERPVASADFWTRGYDPHPPTVDPRAFVVLDPRGGSAELDAKIGDAWVTVCPAPCRNIPLDPSRVYTVNGAGSRSRELKLEPGMNRLQVDSGSLEGRFVGGFLIAAAPVIGLIGVSVAAQETYGFDCDTCRISPAATVLLLSSVAALVVGIVAFRMSGTSVTKDGIQIGSVDPTRFVF